MHSKTKKIIMLFMAFAILVLPVRYALATSFMAQHSNNMEVTQDSNSSSHHANHADMDMESVLVKKEKLHGTCSCDDGCSGGCSGCPHINLGMVSVITPSGSPGHGVWLLANEDSIGITSHVEVSPPNPLSV